MTVQLATGILGGSATYPTIRGTAAPRPALALTRDRQALRTAATFGAALGAVAAGAKAAATAKSLLAVAEVGMVAIEAALADMKAIATTAKDSGTAATIWGLSDTDRAILHSEFEALRTEITDIVNRTLFHNVKLLDGDGGASRSFSFGTGGGSEPGADTTVTISAADAARLATGLESADLLTQATAASAETLVITAQEAAAGIKGALRADQVRLDTAVVVGNHVTAGTATVRDGGLEYQAILDPARALAAAVALEGGLNLYGSDGGLKAGGTLTVGLFGGFNGARSGGDASLGDDAGGAQETPAPRPSAYARPSAPQGGGTAERAAVDITA